MGAMMRNFDWASHPLGEPQGWPQSLKNNIRLMLNSAFPMFIWWSQDLYMFHNDAYLPALGKKHPKALGASAPQMWAEIWDQIGGITENILETGEDFYAQNLLLYLERKGFAEETYWTFSYSPAFNDAGEIAGIFCACNEETSFVLGQRRLKSLKDLSDTLSHVATLEDLGPAACQTLSSNHNDIPFCLMYLVDGQSRQATLAGMAGTVPEQLAPPSISLTNAGEVWPLGLVSHLSHGMVADLAVPAGKVQQAVILPIVKASGDQLAGFFIAGISAAQEYTEDYKGFHSLLAAQMGTSITSVRAKEEILKRQDFLNEIFQQAPVGITILNGPNYIVEIANPRVCEIWRVQQRDVLGKPIFDVLPEAVGQGFKDLLDNVMATGIPHVANEVPLVLERRDRQEVVHLNFVYHPMRDEHGLVTGIIATAIEISEQVAARLEVEAVNKALLATNADLDNFVYAASHDLKAPIFNIEGLMDELLQHLPQEVAASEEMRQLSSYMYGSINRFKRVVSDLTQVARTQREDDENSYAIDLNDVITEVCMDLKPIISETGAVIQTSIAPGTTIRFSFKNMRSVMYNLISNAIKYSSPNRAPYISISTTPGKGFTVLTVADNGLGLEQADAPKIFSLFKRLHDHVDGSGIGLYIVKKIVENAGGRIEVESELDKGTAFKVYLPH